MASRRITRRTVSRSPSRKFVWVRHTVTSTTTGDSVGSDLLSQFETDYGAQLIGCTIVRIRGAMWATTPESGAGVDHLRMGARVESGRGLDLSVALPSASGLFEDENADWMLWQPFFQVRPTAAGAPDELSGRIVDVQSSRRLEELGERLVMVVTPNPAAPTIVWTYGWDLSIGVKLP